MESGDQHQSSPYSWRWASSHNRPPHSRRLHSSLADLDDKMKMILDLLEDSGDTFAKRAEMYYQKRPELIKMVQDLHRSFCVLADKYDQLKSNQSSIKAPNTESVLNLSNSFKKVHSIHDSGKGNLQDNWSVETPSFHSGSIEDYMASDSEDHSGAVSEFESSNLEFQTPKNLMSSDTRNKFVSQKDGSVGEKIWNEQTNFSKLLEENLSNQTELLRRNEKKKEMINELRNENRSLKSCMSINESSHKGKGKGRAKRKFRGLFCLP